MKKNKILWLLPLLMSLLFLSSCTKKPEITAQKAGELLVEEFIYQKESPKFEENFQDSKNLRQAMKESRDKFATSFIEAVTSQNLPAEKATALHQALENALKEKTSYNVKVDKEDKKEAKITYQVTGLSYDAVVERVLQKFIQQVSTDPTIVKESQKTVEFITDNLIAELSNITPQKNSITFPFTFEIEDGKWTLQKEDSEHLNQLFFGFVAGVKSEEEFSAAIQNKISQMTQELEASLIQ